MAIQKQTKKWQYSIQPRALDFWALSVYTSLPSIKVLKVILIISLAGRGPLVLDPKANVWGPPAIPSSLPPYTIIVHPPSALGAVISGPLPASQLADLHQLKSAPPRLTDYKRELCRVVCDEVSVLILDIWTVIFRKSAFTQLCVPRASHLTSLRLTCQEARVVIWLSGQIR